MGSIIEDDIIRYYIANALGHIERDVAEESLIKALTTDENSVVRKWAAGALEDMRSEKAVEPLTRALTTDDDSFVRFWAAGALGKIGSGKAVEPLRSVLTDEGKFKRHKVKDSAFRSLEEISKKTKKRIFRNTMNLY